MALAKIVGFDVTPVTPSSWIRRASPPSVIRRGGGSRARCSGRSRAVPAGGSCLPQLLVSSALGLWCADQVLEGHVGVGQAGGVDRHPAPDEFADGAGDVPDVDVHA